MSTTQIRDRTLSRMISTRAGAGASGVVRATRGKLKRIFCKTGTKRQAELVGLVLNGPAALS